MSEYHFAVRTGKIKGGKKAAAKRDKIAKAIDRMAGYTYYYDEASGSAERNPMLTLSRKKRESIVIGDSIVVTVIEIRGDKVRLGVEAPKEVEVDRSEVRAAKDRKKLEAEGDD